MRVVRYAADNQANQNSDRQQHRDIPRSLHCFSRKVRPAVRLVLLNMMGSSCTPRHDGGYCRLMVGRTKNQVCQAWERLACGGTFPLISLPPPATARRCHLGWAGGRIAPDKNTQELLPRYDLLRSFEDSVQAHNYEDHCREGEAPRRSRPRLW